jgi:hypothetical protein
VATSDRKSQRHATEALVLTYYEAELAGLIEHVTAEGERPDWWAEAGRCRRG